MDTSEDLVAFGDTRNSLITGSKLLLLSMVVLALQDLNLEKHFKGLRKYFLISKKEKRDIENITSALDYVFGDSEDPLSFENFCFVFKLEPSLFRKLIVKYLREDRGLAWTEYTIWTDRHGI